MIVGTKRVNLKELAKVAEDKSTLLAYARGLVPIYLQHRQEIVNNQLYLVALYLRTLESIPWYTRKELCEFLLKGVYITGVPNYIVDVKDIRAVTNIEKLKRYILECNDG